MSAPRAVYLTGMMRSGTTLLAHLMNGFPALDMFAQPLPLLPVAMKARFLAAEGFTEEAQAYPIRTQQFEDHYDPARLLAFLKRERVSAAMAETAAARQESYSGVLARPDDMAARLQAAAGGGLFDTVLAYLDGQRREGRALAGWKETMGEGLLPYYLETGAAAAQIIRDPRDVLRSMNYGDAERHVGAPRPLLFIARQWRKSAACALHCQGLKGYALVRYEDLAADPAAVMKNIGAALGLGAPEQTDPDAAADRQGRAWRGNSSAGGAQPEPPDADRRMMEALCWWEMRALGYRPDLSENEACAVLREGAFQETIAREALADYALTPARRDEEIARFRALADSKAKTPDRAFVFPGDRTRIRHEAG